MVVIKIPVDEKIETELEKLGDEYEELKARMSDLRKKGKDTRIAEILALDYNPNVRMVKVTYDKEDVKKIKRILSDIKAELDEAEKGSDLSQAVELIKEAYQCLRTDKIDEARVIYSRISEIYKKLSPDLRRTIYVACFDISKRLNSKKEN